MKCSQKFLAEWKGNHITISSTISLSSIFLKYSCFIKNNKCLTDGESIESHISTWSCKSVAKGGSKVLKSSCCEQTTAIIGVKIQQESVTRWVFTAEVTAFSVRGGLKHKVSYKNKIKDNSESLQKIMRYSNEVIYRRHLADIYSLKLTCLTVILSWQQDV